ncbi:MAG: hypothetical protein ACK4YO_02360 [Candidatus Altarchaeaceae archaeon]
MKNFYLIFGITITIALLISGCVEQKKEIAIKVNDVIAFVDVDEISIYVEFNDTVDDYVNFYIIDGNETFIGKAKIENKTANFLFNNSDRKLKYGDYKLKAECKAINKTKIFNLQILRYPVYINMDLNFKKIYFKDPLEISINLISGNSSGKEILIYANEKLIGKNLTDDEGNTKFYINLENFSEKKLKIRAIYEGDELFENSSAEEEILITEKIPTKIVARSIETELRDNITLSVNFTTYKNEAINKDLKFYYGSNEIEIINKSNNTYILNISKFKRGNYKIDIVFEGDEIYEGNNNSIILSIAKIYENSGVKIKSFGNEINEFKNKKFSIYTDATNLTKVCAYEFKDADIVDQEKGIPLYIFSGNNEIIIDKEIKIFTQNYENLPCHIFLCEYYEINCSLSKIADTLGDYKNFNIVIDSKIQNKEVLEEYIKILKALGFIQEYLKDKKGKNISINQYIMENNKCAPAENLKNLSDCNFDGIFIIYSNVSEFYSRDGKIFMKGNEKTLKYEEIILKRIILPQFDELIKS